jgi:hypothetical protein
MTPGLALFLLRAVFALMLLAFLGALFWMMLADIQSAARSATARARRLGRLVVLESALPDLPPGSEFYLRPLTSLGRAPTNTASLPDDTASLEHALLHLRDGHWWLEDLASRNGTLLNEVPIHEPAPVVAGDVIGVGQVKLKLELD